MAATEFALIVRAIIRAQAALGAAWLPSCQTAATSAAWPTRSAPPEMPAAHWASQPRIVR
jgi:hypothetical protein